MTETLTDRETSAAAFLRGEPGPGPGWLQALRQKARTNLGKIGFPTTAEEEWRFTNMAPLLDWPLHTAEPAASRIGPAEIEAFKLAGDGYCLVFVDGRFRPELSVLPGKGAPLQAGNLRARWENDGAELEKHLGRHAHCERQFFTALNTVCFEDGALVVVPANVVAERPVQLLYLAASESAGAAVHARNLIVAQAGSSVKIIETYASLTESAQLTNAVTELALGPDARVEHCRLQNESQRGIHVASVQATQDRGSHWLSHSIATGARLARNEIQTRLGGDGAEAILNGLFLGRGEQLMDHHTVVDHAHPHCESHEFYYGILGGRSRGVFNGKIFVRPDAQKTNARQTNRNLLLSENAVIYTKPQLEIFADDVKCTHGATVGQLDEEALFYLRSRGIGAALARRMLVRAFAGDAVQRVTVARVREYLDELLAGRFEEMETRLDSHAG